MEPVRRLHMVVQHVEILQSATSVGSGAGAGFGFGNGFGNGYGYDYGLKQIDFLKIKHLMIRCLGTRQKIVLQKNN